MKKEGHEGILGWSLGIISLILTIVQPFAGLVFGIVGFVISKKERKRYGVNEWTRVGVLLNRSAIIISVIFIILVVLATYIYYPELSPLI